MSRNAYWINPKGHIVKCEKHHVDTLLDMSENNLGIREETIMGGIKEGYIRISFVNDKWLIQLHELNNKERRHLSNWASERKTNKKAAVEILKDSYKKIQTNVLELADGVNLSRRKVLKAAYIAPTLIMLDGLVTPVIADSGCVPGPPCNRPNPPPWCG